MEIANKITKAGMAVILTIGCGLGTMATFAAGSAASPEVALAATSKATTAAQDKANKTKAINKAQAITRGSRPTKSLVAYEVYMKPEKCWYISIDMWSPTADKYAKSAKFNSWERVSQYRYYPFGKYYVDVSNSNGTGDKSRPVVRWKMKGATNWKSLDPTCDYSDNNYHVKVRPGQTIQYQVRYTARVFERKGKRYSCDSDNKIDSFMSPWSTTRTWKNNKNQVAYVSIAHDCYWDLKGVLARHAHPQTKKHTFENYPC